MRISGYLCTASERVHLETTRDNLQALGISAAPSLSGPQEEGSLGPTRLAGYEDFVHCGLLGSLVFSNDVQLAADAIGSHSPRQPRIASCRSR